MNNKIIYGIIILCIVCIILVSVLSTGHKVLDIILVVISGIGILASGVYLKRKNKMTVDDVIYKKIEEDRISAIKKDFYNTFVDYFKGPTYENDKESQNYVLGQIENEGKFEYITNNYLNNLNNNLSIEEYYKKILPLFDYTENNKDDLKKNIIKYVVFYYLPKYNKKGVVKPLNYKKLVYLYIKDNTDINNEMIENRTKYYVDIVLETVKVFKPDLKTVKNAQIIINNLLARTDLRIAYSTLKTNDEKEIFINYINELLGNYNNKVGITDFIADKITAKVAPDSPYSGSADDKDLDPKIYNQIEKYKSDAIKHNKFNEEFQKYFKDLNNNDQDSDDYVLEQIQNYKTFLSTTKDYLNNNNLSIEEYYKEILPLFDTDDLKKNIIKYVVFYYLSEYNKVGVEKPHNYKILVDLYIKNKIKNDVDYILSEQRKFWNNLNYTNLEALTPNAQNKLNTMYNEFKTNYEKDILIDYIKELLKDVKKDDVEKKINKIIEVQIYNHPMLN